MADTRLLWLMIAAACLITASTAIPNVHDAHDTTDLRQLLGEMRRYLRAQDEHDRSNRANAHDDVRTVYDSCKISLR